MVSNRKAKEKLIERYGAECFIEALRLRPDTEKRKYRGKGQKAKMKQLTYHHISMRKNGGKATIENGALLSAENHAWFHKQDKQAQVRMNELFQEYKKWKDDGELEVEYVDNLHLDFKIKVMEFQIDDKILKNEKYNRTKEKQKLRKMIDEDFLIK